MDTQHHRTVSARFGCIKGQPILTNLPYGRYVCVRIPCFYHWWDDLNRFSEVLEQANALACSLVQRDVRPEFFVDFVDSNVIFFKMDVLLNDDEAYCDALPDVCHQLNLVAKAVYGYLKAYNDEYEKKEVSR